MENRALELHLEIFLKPEKYFCIGLGDVVFVIEDMVTIYVLVNIETSFSVKLF